MNSLNEKNAIIEANNSAEQKEKKAYKAPELIPHGSLTDLVQNFPNRAHDGGTFDCTFC
jgi:hypothetical protein